MEGTITRIPEGKDYFFIDSDYWCHIRDYNQAPEIGDIVSFSPGSKPDGKKFAKNVKFLRNTESHEKAGENSSNMFNNYKEALANGYFNDSNYLKEELIIYYPLELANKFADRDRNKSATINQYFRHLKSLESIYNISKDFEYIKSKVLEIIPIVNKSYNKERATVSKEFVEFIELNVRLSVENVHNFINGFLPHFQSIIGYYKSR
jgi:hypothetical protein